MGLKTRNQSYFEKFSCVLGKSATEEQSKLNKFIIDELSKLYDHYSNEGDKGRIIAYRKAISVIKGMKVELTSLDQLNDLAFIGKKMKDKILEIIETGRLRKADNIESNERGKIISEFSKIWGVGPNGAQRLYSKGFRSIKELRENSEDLSSRQLIGLKYFEEFSQRIPYEEVAEIEKFVMNSISSFSKQKFEVMACGSFRRKKANCGDIDILICPQNDPFESNFLSKLIESLEENGFLTDHLQNPTPNPNADSYSYMGVCYFSSKIHRRIDIKIYSRKNFPFALLYFTGSDYFNRSMRLLAKKKGFSLTDFGLFRVNRNSRKSSKRMEERVECKDEREVFAALEIPYKEPTEREI